MAVNRLACFLGLLLCLLAVQDESLAWVFVDAYGETGWQRFTCQAGPAGFSGTAGFVVSKGINIDFIRQK